VLCWWVGFSVFDILCQASTSPRHKPAMVSRRRLKVPLSIRTQNHHLLTKEGQESRVSKDRKEYVPLNSLTLAALYSGVQGIQSTSTDRTPWWATTSHYSSNSSTTARENTTHPTTVDTMNTTESGADTISGLAWIQIQSSNTVDTQAETEDTQAETEDTKDAVTTTEPVLLYLLASKSHLSSHTETSSRTAHTETSTENQSSAGVNIWPDTATSADRAMVVHGSVVSDVSFDDAEDFIKSVTEGKENVNGTVSEADDENLTSKFQQLLVHNTKLVDILQATLALQADLLKRVVRFLFS